MARRKKLTTELAGPTQIRNVWGPGSVASGLTPQRLSALLQASDEGDALAYLTLAEEMEERDPHYSSVLRTRKLAVSGLQVNVYPGSEDNRAQKLADDVTQLTQTPQFYSLIDDSLDALGKGYSVSEIIWDRSGTRWTPTDYKWRDPRFFIQDQDHPNTLRLIDDQNPAQGIPLEPYKFITHVPKLKSGISIRGGLARLVAMSYLCKMYGIKDWLAFLELYGIPMRVGRYGASASKDDKDILKQAVTHLGSDAAAILPESMLIEFHQASHHNGASEVFANMVEWVDKQVSKAVLGQTASTEGTPGKLGNEQSQEAVRQDLIAADARHLATTLNRDLVRPYIDLNYGPQDVYPKITITIPEREDLAGLAENLSKLVPLGLQVSAAEVRTKLGLSEPKNDAEILRVSPASLPPAETNRALNRQTEELDEYDPAVADMLEDWEPQVDEIVTPVREAVEQADSYDQLIEALPDLLAKMNPEKLTNALAKAGLVGYGMGVEAE